MASAAIRATTHRFLDRHFSGQSMDYRQIIALIIPILIDQAFIIGLNLVNTAMISSSGVAAVSAVNMVDSLNIFLINVFVAVATGGTVVVAQYKGSRNDAMVSKASSGSVSSVVLLALAISLLIIAFHIPTLNLLFGSAEADVFQNAKSYLIGSSLSFCGIAIVEAVCGVLRGIGKSRASLMLSLIMNLTYVALNFVLINLADMGIMGMNISVNVSRYLAAACAIYYLVKMDESLRVRLRDMLQVNWTMLKKILSIGMPFAAEQMFFNGGKILTQIFIVSLGTYAIAANAISASLAMVIQIPANALSIAIVTVVGQCIGRREIEDARKLTRSFLWLSSATFVVMGLLILPLFHPLVSLFHPPAEIVDEIFTIVLINTIAQIPLWAISFITPSALRAAGDAKYTSVVSMLSMWLFRVVLGYILGVVLPFGVVGVWLAMDIEWGIRGLIFLRRFRGTKWYRHRLVED
ncbi:MAG: MATE family efflux transporter [Paenibacillaceae bacterium]|uniref:Probable multidrug resistance protein NorM n=2 Tax=Paenibacillus mellifer TaxID=2937794 RepID=A0A9X1Y562_9BACL|nr:MATE family efflux transporter [Paenibacillus mellifer]MBW4838594.1 MATE family efflux transporter [Paenibacillaceae bacterium]MCK8489836.1 MATE family efflux transporter [Paenibacillus mellifer]